MVGVGRGQSKGFGRGSGVGVGYYGVGVGGCAVIRMAGVGSNGVEVVGSYG